MRGSEKLLGTLIAATLVAGVVGLLTKDTTPDMMGSPPSPTPTLGESPSPSPTVGESPSPSPTVAESPTKKPKPKPTPPPKPRTAESGIGTSYLLGLTMLLAAGAVWRFRRAPA